MGIFILLGRRARVWMPLGKLFYGAKHVEFLGCSGAHPEARGWCVYTNSREI